MIDAAYRLYISLWWLCYNNPKRNNIVLSKIIIPTLQNNIKGSLLPCHYISMESLSFSTFPVMLPQFLYFTFVTVAENVVQNNVLCPNISNLCCSQRPVEHPSVCYYEVVFTPYLEGKHTSRGTSIKQQPSWQGKGHLKLCHTIVYRHWRQCYKNNLHATQLLTQLR